MGPFLDRDDELASLRLNAPFPLTPALSLGRGRQARPLWAIPQTQDRRAFPPRGWPTTGNEPAIFGTTTRGRICSLSPRERAGGRGKRFYAFQRALTCFGRTRLLTSRLARTLAPPSCITALLPVLNGCADRWGTRRGDRVSGRAERSWAGA